VVDGIEICFDPKSFDEVVSEVVRSTKSVLEASKSEEVFFGPDNKYVWIPKKSESVSITTNG
jgi:hypothetical protein